MNGGAPTFRFAPTPNGALHLGHAFSALANFDAARSRRGVMLLRMDNIDTARCSPRFEADIETDLAWLGLDWPAPVRRQTDFAAEYRAALDRLRAMGLAYPAFLTRSEARERALAAGRAGRGWPRDPDGAPHYPGTERALPRAERARLIAAGKPFAWRLDMAKAAAAAGPLAWLEEGRGPAGETGAIRARPEIWGDAVLMRRDGAAGYHLAVVVDDAAQGVSDVVRGHDLFHATAVHRLLQAFLDLPVPRYRHHRLLTGSDGRKLSKSRADPSLATLRAGGLGPADIRRLCEETTRI